MVIISSPDQAAHDQQPPMAPFSRSNHTSTTTLTQADGPTTPRIKIESETGSVRDQEWEDDEEREDDGAQRRGAAMMAGEKGPQSILPNMGSQSGRRRRNRMLMIVGGGLLLVIAVAGIIGGVVVTHHKKPSNGSSSGSNGGAQSNHPITGGDGSTVYTETGATFIYNNSFGGFWVQDPKNPLDAGRAQSWTPPLNETWTWGQDKVHGVNLGGWLVMEPFITPAYYQKYYNTTPKAIDEWTLSQAMAADTASGGLGQLEDHYNTFITEVDFAQIAGAGLNWVRIPLPFWAMYKFDDEPFLEGTAWKYFLKALGWARKYGLRINLDLHTIPGSQNGWNHSGKYGQINFLNGVMGVANAQRTLNYIRILTEFISQPQYSGIVPMFGIINEPVIDMPTLGDFYYQAYTMIRNISGIGAGNGPIISINKPLLDTVQWTSYLPGADRIALDIHPYYAFGGTSNDTLDAFARRPCANWASVVNTTSRQYGIIAAGEFSAAVNDCGFWTVGVDWVSTYETAFGAGSCDKWVDWENYTDDIKTGLKNFVMAEMDTLQDYFFWTWKIAPQSVTGKIEQPFWSYSLGLANGWIPTDPREASGFCESLGYAQNDTFDGNYPPAATGGAGAGTLSAGATQSIVWTPTTLSDEANARALPTYTPTGTIISLAVPTITEGAGVLNGVMGNGWKDSTDKAGLYVPVQGCTYPDPWDATAAAIPPVCTGA